MEDTTKNETLKRLNYIEGHLNGIKRMVADGQYCVDILKQTYAVRRAIEKLEAHILEGHLRGCVPAAIQGGETDRVVAELMALYELKPAFPLTEESETPAAMVCPVCGEHDSELETERAGAHDRAHVTTR